MYREREKTIVRIQQFPRKKGRIYNLNVPLQISFNIFLSSSGLLNFAKKLSGILFK